MSKKALLWFSFFFLGLIGSSMAQTVSEPPYALVRSEPPFEVRDYGVLTVAETLIDGDFDVAGSLGFRRVAGYIFGKNQNAKGESEKIAMTAPVTMEATDQQWRLHFVMPQGMVLGQLPKPLDASVQLRELPAQRMAAVRFSGLTTAASIERNTQLLKDWLVRNALAFDDRPQLARYNDPFTAPWNRRNEILIPLKAR
ncbi:MAG: heme-binding protein [Comamonadaceae bacterium]|jgi:hypothetical protein|nr:heme-binding protein [Comamonadaceae bacterium]